MKLLASCACLLVGLSASAEESTDPRSGPQQPRELNGHLFIPSFNISDPFVPTALSLEVGGGFSDVSTIYPLAPNVPLLGNGRYRMAVTAETLGFQAHVTRWLGLRASGSATTFIGTSAQSAVAAGSELISDTAVGATASGRLGRMVRLGGTFDFDYRVLDEVIPVSGISATQATGQLSLDTSKSQAAVYRALPGVALAVAPHPALGISASLQLAVEKQHGNVREGSVYRFDAGLALDLDIHRLARRAPVGLMASYRLEAPVISNEVKIHELDGGVFYTGRDNLSVGVIARGRWFELRPGFSAPTFIASLALRYFWN